MRIDYDSGIADSDKSVVETSIRNTSAYLQRQFGVTVVGPVIVSVRNADGPFAVKGPFGSKEITVYVRHEGWETAGPMHRTKMMAHEVYEILQEEVGWPGNWGGWVQEGSAEFMGDAVAIDAGMAGIDEVRRCYVSKYFSADGPSAVPLEELVDFDVHKAHGRFVIAWLAWDRLLNGPGGAPKIAVFWRSGFQSAFGRTEDAFYQEFRQYRRELQRPGGDACSSLDRR